MAAFIILFGLLLTKTVYGRRVLATGGNSAAAKYAGINDKAVIMGAFIYRALVPRHARMRANGPEIYGPRAQCLRVGRK